MASFVIGDAKARPNLAIEAIHGHPPQAVVAAGSEVEAVRSKRPHQENRISWLSQGPGEINHRPTMGNAGRDSLMD